MAGVSKVVLDDEVLLDLTADTVYANVLKKGIKAHRKDGTVITGSLVYDTPGSTFVSKTVYDYSDETIIIGVGGGDTTRIVTLMSILEDTLQPS